jgi:hypothetical protein
MMGSHGFGRMSPAAALRTHLSSGQATSKFLLRHPKLRACHSEAAFGEQARCGERRRPPAVERARGASRPSGAGSDSGTSSTAVCGARRRQARPHRGRGSSTWLASHARARMRQCPRSPRSRSKTSAASRSCGTTG